MLNEITLFFKVTFDNNDRTTTIIIINIIIL